MPDFFNGLLGYRRLGLDLFLFLRSLAFFGLGLFLHFVFVGQKVHQGADIGSQSAFSFEGRFSANTKFLLPFTLRKSPVAVLRPTKDEARRCSPATLIAPVR